MKNKKGMVLPLLLVQVSFIGIGLACLWHIPAWSKAKANHTEAQYQAQQMWPQQVVSKLGN